MRIETIKPSIVFSDLSILALTAIIVLSLLSQGLAVIMCIFLSGLILFERRRIKINKPAVGLLYILTLTLIVAVINGSSLSLLTEEIIRLLSYFLYFSVIISFMKTDKIDAFFKILTVFIISSAILYPLLKYHGRFTSFFPHPNHLAYACNLLIAYFLVVGEINKKYDRGYIFSLFVMIILSASSGGLIAATITLLLFFFKKNLVKFLLVALIIITIGWLLKDIESISLIFEKFNSVKLGEIESRSDKLAFGNDTSLVWRITYWYAIIDNLLKFPITNQLFGLGVGTMSFPDYYFNWMITDPHNDYVRKIAETGFIGAVIYFAIWVKILIHTKYRIFHVSTFFIPMIVGNMIVNVTFLFLYLLLVERFRR